MANLTLYAIRTKTKFGFKTGLYDKRGMLKGFYPDNLTQPHGNKKHIVHNCWNYKLKFMNIKPVSEDQKHKLQEKIKEKFG